MANKAKKVSKMNGGAFLRTALLGVEDEFRRGLIRKKESVTHDGTLGDASEDDWIDLLRKYLPRRYQVAKAFAVDHEGRTTDQLDCLIYDAHFTPALFGKNHHLYVPAEAVYATFEIKQSVTATHLEAASKKAASIRKLARTSAPIPWANGVNPARKPFPILSGLLAVDAPWVDGLGKSFSQQVTRWTSDAKIDFVLTASAGFYDHLDPSKSPTIAVGDGALMRGLFRLLTALRDKSSVVAIEWDKYEQTLVQTPAAPPAKRKANPRASSAN